MSRRLRDTTRDKEFWKRLCFEDATSAATQKRRDFQFIAPSLLREPSRVFELQRRARALSANPHSRTSNGENSSKKKSERLRAIADWDPSYTTEKIDWYKEYIARHAPISMGWLQQPDALHHGNRETKGLGKYDREDKSLIIAPLDDGSLCVWDVGQQDDTTGRAAGAVVARSKPNLFSTYLTDSIKNPYMSSFNHTVPNIVECISVDKFRNKAYVAVHNDLNEVDLETLQASSSDPYPFQISALSDATFPLPLTVATAHSLHLHDPRESRNARFSGSDQSGQVECNTAALPPSPGDRNNLCRLIASGDSGTYAPLSQPGPLSITHVPSATGQHDAWGGHICVAGRFPSILTYNRRMFPRINSTVHSGSRLASITSLPYPLLYPKARPPSNLDAAHTLIACGEYNGKGSLELFPFSTTSQPNPPVSSSSTFSSSSDTPAIIPYKNRTTASRSKLLSIAPHGTRLVFSDGDGGLKWVERDGHSLVRRWNINAYNASTTLGTNPPSLLSQMFANANASSTHDGGSVARKILPIRTWEEDPRGELAVWTGEKIGVLGFRPKPRFEWEWEREEGREEGREEREYKGRMRRALERQADEVRFVRGLGMGDG